MPIQVKPRPGVFAWLMLSVLMLTLGYVARGAFDSYPWFTAALVLALVVSVPIALRPQKRRLAALAFERSGESTCEFARSFDAREVDTWIIRAVYEQIQKELEHAHPKFPVHATDRIEEDLLGDADALDMSIAPAVADRTGRSLEGTQENPYFGKVRTVEDLVFFFNAQPPSSAALSRPSDRS